MEAEDAERMLKVERVPHDDGGMETGERNHEWSGLKVRRTFGLPDRRGRELINCRNGRGERGR